MPIRSSDHEISVDRDWFRPDWDSSVQASALLTFADVFVDIVIYNKEINYKILLRNT